MDYHYVLILKGLIALVIIVWALRLLLRWIIRSLESKSNPTSRLDQARQASEAVHRIIDADSILKDSFAHMRLADARWVELGERMADDCYQNGLLKGQAVLLEDMERQIEADYPQDAGAVKNGFLNRMLARVQSDEVGTLIVEGGNTLFVHRTQGKAVMQALKTSRDSKS